MAKDANKNRETCSIYRDTYERILLFLKISSPFLFLVIIVVVLFQLLTLLNLKSKVALLEQTSSSVQGQIMQNKIHISNNQESFERKLSDELSKINTVLESLKSNIDNQNKTIKKLEQEIEDTKIIIDRYSKTQTSEIDKKLNKFLDNLTEIKKDIHKIRSIQVLNNHNSLVLPVADLPIVEN